MRISDESSYTLYSRNRFACFFSRVKLFLYWTLYRFDFWHVMSSYDCKPYKQQVVGILNQYDIKSVVEIGCGLGDIVSRVSAPSKFGIDREVSAVAVAKKIDQSTRYIVASLDQVEDSLNYVDQVDCFMLINFTHNIETDLLVKELKHLLTRFRPRYIFVDIIKHDFRGYRYHHKVMDFNKLQPSSINSFDSVDRVRSFLLLSFDGDL